MVTETEDNSKLNTEAKAAIAEVEKVVEELDPEVLVPGSKANREYLGVKSWYSQNKDFIILGLLALLSFATMVVYHYRHTGR